MNFLLMKEKFGSYLKVTSKQGIQYLFNTLQRRKDELLMMPKFLVKYIKMKMI